VPSTERVTKVTSYFIFGQGGYDELEERWARGQGGERLQGADRKR
jgi:hypothetical protein